MRRSTLPSTLLLLGLLSWIFAGCRSIPAPVPGPVRSEDLAALCREIENLLFADRVAEALPLARDLAARHPGDLQVRRALQDCRVAAGDDHGALEDARAALDADPGDGVALYLAARMEVDGDAAESLLRRAVAVRPDLLLPRLAMAQVRARREDLAGARRWLVSADGVSPGSAWVALVASSVQARDKDAEGALALLEEAVRRDADWAVAWDALARATAAVPGRGARVRAALSRSFALVPRRRTTAREWRRALDEEGVTEDELREAVAAVERAEASGTPLTGAARHLRGAALLAQGRPDAAERDLLAALEDGESRTRVLDDLRRCRFRTGRYALAVAMERAWTPPDLLDDATDRRDVGRHRLARAAARAERDGEDGEALLDLLEECRRAGWLREAALVAKRRAELLPADPAAAEDVRETTAVLRFLDRFRTSWKERYFAYSGGDEDGSLEDGLAALRDLSLEELGVDLSDGMARRDYGLLGSMADSVRANGTCGRWFRAHGLALVVGSAAGRPVEARLLRVVAEHDEREYELLGRRFPATVVVGEGLLVPSLMESSGAVLGGFTAGDLVFVDLEGVALWAAESRRIALPGPEGDLLRAVAPVPAADREEEASLRHPGRLSDRIALRSPSWRDPLVALSDFLDGALRHELAHAADAHGYLPVWRHPLAGLGLLFRGRFSGGGVAALLEGDAEIVSLAASRSTWAALSTLVSYLPGSDGGSPHVAGYHGAVRDLVEELQRRGVRPVEGERVNLLRSLDRVDPEVLRAAALEICRHRGRAGGR